MTLNLPHTPNTPKERKTVIDANKSTEKKYHIGLNVSKHLQKHHCLQAHLKTVLYILTSQPLTKVKVHYNGSHNFTLNLLFVFSYFSQICDSIRAVLKQEQKNIWK